MVYSFLAHFLFSTRSGSVVRRIAWLTVVSLSVSVAALILVLSVMNALNDRIQDRTLAAEPHLFVSVQGLQSFDVLNAHPVVEKMRSMANWRVHLHESQDVILRTADGRFQGAIARGLSRQGLEFVGSQIRAVNAKQNGIESSSVQETGHVSHLSAGEVIIGVDLARGLSVYEGDALMVLPPESLLLAPGEAPLFEKVIVKKILTSNLSEVDAKAFFYESGKSLIKFSNTASRHLGVEVWTPDPQSVDSVKDLLEKYEGVHVETWKTRNSALFMALVLEKFVIGTFLGLASLVAGFSLLSVMGLLISQKRREFGLLQALGLGQDRLRRLLVGMGVGLGMMGLLAGLILGVGTALYIEWHPLRILPDIYYDAEIPARVDWFLILMVVLFGSLLATIGAWFSSRQIQGQNPSELLRNQARSG